MESTSHPEPGKHILFRESNCLAFYHSPQVEQPRTLPLSPFSASRTASLSLSTYVAIKKVGIRREYPDAPPPPSRGHPGYSTRPVPAAPLITSPLKSLQHTTLHRPFDPRNEDYWGRLKKIPSLSLIPGQARLPAKENFQESPAISAGVSPTLCTDDEGRADTPVQEDSRENIPPSRTKLRDTPPTPGKSLEGYIAQRKNIRESRRGAIPLGRSLDDLLNLPIWVQEEPAPTTSRTTTEGRKGAKRNLKEKFLDLFGEVTDSEEEEPST